jgi:hypothetical protein
MREDIAFPMPFLLNQGNQRIDPWLPEDGYGVEQGW